MNCDPTLATQDVWQAWKVPKIMERNRCSEINLLHEAIHKYVQGGDLSEAQFAGLTGVLHLFLGWVVQFGKFMTEEWMVARENFNIFKLKTFSNWQNGDFGRWDEIYQGQWFLRRVRAAKVEREKLQCHRGHAENIQASTCTDVASFFCMIFLY